MNPTSLSLLEQLRGSTESESWNRLVELYAPLLRNWIRKYDVQDSDAEDLTQEVLLAVTKDLPKFEHAGHPGAFRGWLKSILVNRLRNFWRERNRRPQPENRSSVDARIDLLDDPASSLSEIWNREHDRYVLRQLLVITEPNFAPKTWKAFCRVALEGASSNVVAEELEISLNAVCLAKSRVLRRLRQESEGLIESGSGFFTKR